MEDPTNNVTPPPQPPQDSQKLPQYPQNTQYSQQYSQYSQQQPSQYSQQYTQYSQYYPQYPQYTYPQYPVAPYNPNSKGKCFGRSLLPLAVFMGVQAVCSVAAVIFFMAFYAPITQGGMLDQDALMGAILPPVQFISTVICLIILPLWYAREIRPRTFRPKGYPPGYPLVTIEPFALSVPGEKGPGILFLVGAVTAVAANFLITGFFSVLQNLYPSESSVLDDAINSIPENSAGMWVFFFCLAVIGPIAEELCLRGLCYNYLRRGFAFWSANLIQALLFAVIHGNVTQGSYAFLLGLAFGWIYEKTRRLSIPIALHIAFNSASVLLSFIPGVEQIMAQNQSTLIVVILPSFAVTVAGILSTIAILRQTKNSSGTEKAMLS